MFTICKQTQCIGRLWVHRLLFVSMLIISSNEHNPTLDNVHTATLKLTRGALRKLTRIPARKVKVVFHCNAKYPSKSSAGEEATR